MNKLNGLILAGGRSSRMGFDKSQLIFHDKPQVIWLNELLRSFCEQVFVSGNPEKIQGQFNFIEDHYQSGGPMNGVLSAFKRFSLSTWLVVPVDMPNVDKTVISFLLKHRDSSKLGTCFVSSKEMVEPLPVMLEPSAYPVLLNRFKKEDDSLKRFLSDEETEHVTVPDDDWLINVNLPSQLGN